MYLTDILSKYFVRQRHLPERLHSIRDTSKVTVRYLGCAASVMMRIATTLRYDEENASSPASRDAIEGT
jgi:hypothetical protein